MSEEAMGEISPRSVFHAVVLILLASAFCQGRTPPHVLFIAVDDLNDWVGHLGGHPQAQTPHLDRLAKRGVTFTRAYCSAPLCNPSRVSLLTGIEPLRSRVFGNGERLRDHLPHAVTLMQHLRAHGYRTCGGGKIFHGVNRAVDEASWDHYFRVPPRRQALRPTSDLPPGAWAPWGPLDVADDDAMFDVQVVNWAIEELGRPQERPLFLACGFTKPHLPWFVPKQYFDAIPLSQVQLPHTLAGDRDDLPAFGRKLAREVHTISNGMNHAKHGEDHAMVLRHGQWQRAVQSYLATIRFVDTHVGRLLDALAASPHAENTLVVLWGDHGWHLGEKQHWRKHALWETTTRTTLIVAGPGVGRGTCARVVSLIDLYPTLLELCGVPGRRELDGRSLVPWLVAPTRGGNGEALMTYGRGNHALRTDRWRFIQYHDGGEELYDHHVDPHEWHNLAGQTKYRDTVHRLRQSLRDRLTGLESRR